jgi:hypothetical protein
MVTFVPPNELNALAAQTATSLRSVASGASTSGAGGNVENTFVGVRAADALTTATATTAIGFQALQACTTGPRNTAVGMNALYGATSNGFNTAVGQAALVQCNGQFDIALGDSALSSLLTGSYNIGIGYLTGGGLDTGSNNVIIGSQIAGLPGNMTNAIVFGTGDGTIRADYNKAGNNAWVFAAPAIMPVSTFSALPAANAALKGARATISDSAASPVFSAAAAGGGSLCVPVYCDGVIWRNG